MKNSIPLFVFVFVLISFVSKAQNEDSKTYLKANIGHTDAITDFVLSNNNKYLVTCSEDKSIILWDFETAKEIKSITGHKHAISCVDMNKENTRIAAGEGSAQENIDFKVRVWDIVSGKEISTIIPDAGRIKSVKFVNDASDLWIAGEQKIVLYNLESNTASLELTGFDKPIIDISISQDGKIISAASANKIYIWDDTSREPIKTIENNSGTITSMALGPKGNTILVGGEDQIIRTYNTITGKESNQTALHRHPVISLALDNSKKFVISSDKKSSFFKISEYSSGNELHNIEAHAGRVGLIKMSSNNLFVITAGSWDRKVKLWNINNGAFVKEFSGIKKHRYQRVFADSTKYYALGSHHNKVFINFMNRGLKNKEISGKHGEVACVTLNREKSLMGYGTGDNYFTILNLANKEEVFSSTAHDSWIRHIAFSPDNNFVATASYKQLKIWDIKSKKEVLSLRKKFKIPHQIEFSNNSDMIAIGGKRATKIYDIVSGKKVKKIRAKHTAKAIDFSENDEYIATGYGKAAKDGHYSVHIWKLDQRKPVKTLKGHDEVVSDVEFSDGDSLIVTSGKDDIKVWHVSQAEEKQHIEAHARWINDIEVNNNNNKEIISTSEDGTVKVWDMQTGKLLLTQIGIEGSEDWIAFTPDGRFNGTDNGIRSFYFVKDMKIVPLENLFEKFYTPKLNASISRGLDENDVTIHDLQSLPEIAIQEPSQEVPMFRGSVATLLSTDEKRTNVKAQVTDMGGGIDEVRVYQNNKLIETTEVSLDKKGETITQDFDIQLSKGLNVIEVASYNKDRTKNSKKIGIEYTGDEFNPASLYIFAIGINNYKKPTYNLNYAISDATSFVDELTRNSSSIFDTTHVISLTNEQATKDSITQCFHYIMENARQNDVFVFYYAGHGSMSAPQGGQEAEFYLIPWEVTNLYNNMMLKDMGIAAQTLQEFSKKIHAQKQLFVLDACQSGGAVEYLASRGAEEEKAIAQLAHSTGTYFITASGSQQLAGEFGTLGHGVFTYAILEGLKGKASLSDRKVTVKGLTYYVEEQVPVLSEKYKGNPQYPASYGFGQDFPLVLITKE